MSRGKTGPLAAVGEFLVDLLMAGLLGALAAISWFLLEGIRSLINGIGGRRE